MGYPTLLDILKANNAGGVAAVIDEVSKAHPEISLGAARTIPGLSYETLVRTGLGRTTGSFRDANAGSTPIKNTYANRKVETFIDEARIECDKAVADRSIDGPTAYIAMESEGVLEGEMQGLCRQFYYGRNTNGNSQGYPGLIDAYDATNMAVDAGGTTDDVATSVWAVKFGPQGVQFVYGQNGMFAFSPTRIESIIDPNDSTKKFDGYVRTLLFYPGVQCGSVRAIGRIKKLTTDSGKGLTDALISQLLSKFEVGVVPDVLLMTRRSRQQLQASRTATNQTGSPAPIPTESFGVRIEATDAIVNTEKLAS